ncbi:hypothetical protein K490DRAFT_56754 [Saccharata proteae CBS 121410]|uniref:Uncharacterized protein n=1 Tax=Saccharata proteae CBS 121410 TaxID=1314787 RepID=A0A9P4LZ19_9PEZI|nr:hypothetical protein K490DRAFT_56754 [Saccharata proteae CBS 121410]
MLLIRSSRAVACHAGQIPLLCSRSVSTLPNNPNIYIFPDTSNTRHTLSLLATSPPTPSLAIGTTTSIPPTPATFKENPTFLGILQSVLHAHAAHDPVVQSQAAAYASQSGSALGTGGLFFPQNHPSQQRNNKRQFGSKNYAGGSGGGAGGGGAGGASAQGGAGSGGRGGWIHVSDMRNPPDYGRIAWPEDIFGSLEVDGRGQFVGDRGNYQDSGTYRLCTNEGILGLSDYLRERLVERLRELEEQERSKS